MTYKGSSCKIIRCRMFWFTGLSYLVFAFDSSLFDWVAVSVFSEHNAATQTADGQQSSESREVDVQSPGRGGDDGGG
jgi:hypothetical protein